MTLQTLTRRTPGPVGRPATGRRPVRDLAVAVLAAGVVAGGTWGLLVPREAPHAAHVPVGLATVQLADGTLRVEGLVDKQIGHVMPGMSVAEDVPEGMRRIGVNVSLGATGDGALSYSRSAFTVSGPGVAAITPATGQLGDGTLTSGQAISGSLSFDVPKDATALSLRFNDVAPIALPPLPPMATAGGHAPAQVPAPAPAGPEHHDAPGSAPHDH